MFRNMYLARYHTERSKNSEHLLLAYLPTQSVKFYFSIKNTSLCLYTLVSRHLDNGRDEKCMQTFGRKFSREDMTLRSKCRLMSDVKVDLRKMAVDRITSVGGLF